MDFIQCRNAKIIVARLELCLPLAIHPLEAVPQLLFVLKIMFLLGFKALFTLLFLPILNCCATTLIFKNRKL